MLQFYQGKYFCCLLLIISVQAVIGQCTIKGRVTDSVNAPVPFAAVGLLNAKDSSLVKGVLCNDSGKYTFNNIKAGYYLVKADVIGYVTQYGQPTKVDSGNASQIPDLQLKGNSNNLKSVKVVADKPFMERQSDKIIFNVENSILSAGKNVLEMLNDLPGVTATDDGIINVLGKSGTLVMVDGKPIRIDLATYLKSIDAGTVEKIEVITNPSAKYEAAGKAVINVVLKRNRNLGLNGELFSGVIYGEFIAFNEGLNFNYRTKKFNFFGDLNFRTFHNYITHTIEKTFYTPGSANEIFDETAPFTPHGNILFGNIGIDYMPDKRQTISFATEGHTLQNNILLQDNTLIHTSATTLDSSINATNNRVFDAQQIIPNISYKFKIDSTGRELDAYAEYGINFIQNNQNYPVSYYNSSGDLLRPSALSYAYQPSNFKEWNLQVDYTQPLSKKAKIETGFNGVYFKTDNDASFYNVINGLSITDTTKSNHFIYTQHLYEGYITYSQKLSEKFNFQLGLRAEETQDNGVQYVHDTSFSRNYLDLFPSASLNWNPSALHSFTLSYTRRIDRPDVGDMNPFLVQIDPYTYQQGNINLLPQLSDNYEFDYFFHQYYGLTLGHIYVTNVQGNTYVVNNTTRITYSTPMNLNTYSAYNAMLTVSLPVSKWWTTTSFINAYHDDYFGNYEGSNYNNTNWTFQLRCSNSFTFKHGWRAEASFWYATSNLNVFTLEQPVNDLELGLSKRFFDDRLTLNLNCSDVFKGSVQNSTTQLQNLTVLDALYLDNRKVRFSITWKFGKSQYHREETNKTGALLKGTKQ